MMPTPSLHELLQQAPCLGVGGARAPGPVTAAAVAWIIVHMPDVPIHVGDAPGVDQLVRDYVGIGRYTPYDVIGKRVPYRLVARTTDCVLAVVAAQGYWIAFPDRPCPEGLVPNAQPRACFSGKGSGTWAATALAVGKMQEQGSRMRVLLFLPPPIMLPGRLWGWTPLEEDGWWYAAPSQEVTTQHSFLGREP